MKNKLPFHTWLRQARLALDIGRTELARQAGCSLAMIRQLEYGNRRPSRELAERLARYLQIPVEERESFLRAARVSAHGHETGEGEALEGEAPEAEGEGRPRHGSLPELPNQIIGRERDLSATKAIICGPETRLLTLLGPGGVGKTRMALQLAHELGPEFPEGVFFVSLAPISDPTLMPVVIAQALDLHDIKAEAPLDMLFESLSSRAALLVLDNAEHLPEVQPLVSKLLLHCPRLKMIVTSRSPLRLHLEQQFVVPPLPVPDLVALEQQPEMLVEHVEDYAALRLFVSRARMAQPAFSLTRENVATIAQICAHLDGLPLAIELAAARIRGLPPQTMLARLNSQLDLLTGGSADLPERQQTMRATIDWSYHLLSPSEQKIFRRLGIFVGDWTLEAAEAICASPGESPLPVMNIVLALLDKSLLQEHHREGGKAAFMLLEVIREYAQRRLRDAGEADELGLRHARYYTALAEAAEPQLTSPQQQLWLNTLAWERDNVRAALEWLIQEGEAEAALRLVGSIWKFWQFRDHWSEGLRWIEAALALPAEQSRAYLQARLKVLWGAGWLSIDQRNKSLAKAMFSESLQLARSIQDQRGIALALHGTGLLAEWQGDLQQAMSCYQESLRLLRQLEDTEEIAWSLRHLGTALQAQGRYGESFSLYEEALELFRAIGHQWGIILQSMTMGHFYLEQGSRERAITLLNESLALAQAQNYQHLEIEILRHLGRAAQDQGDYDEALRLYEQSLALAREIQDGSGIRWGLAHLGGIALALGDYPLAHTRLSEALALARQHEPPWVAAWLQAKLGRNTLEQGEIARAQALFTESLLFYHKNDLRWGFAECMEGLAAIISRRDQPAELERAARMLGAADALRASLNSMRSVMEHSFAEQTREQLRSLLGEQALADALQVGSALSLDQIISLAVE